MPEPIISVPWSDETQTLLDWNKVKVNGELATDLLVDRNQLRARVAELEAALEPLVRLYAGQITNTGEYYPQLFDAAKLALNPTV